MSIVSSIIVIWFDLWNVSIRFVSYNNVSDGPRIVDTARSFGEWSDNDIIGWVIRRLICPNFSSIWAELGQKDDAPVLAKWRPICGNCELSPLLPTIVPSQRRRIRRHFMVLWRLRANKCRLIRFLSKGEIIRSERRTAVSWFPLTLFHGKLKQPY